MFFRFLEQFETAYCEIQGIECWSARELRSIFGYSRCENFINTSKKARKSCEMVVELVTTHFRDGTKMVELGSGSQRENTDNNTVVREMLQQRGIKPESLTPAEDVAK
jgi:hypothetical protein